MDALHLLISFPFAISRVAASSSDRLIRSYSYRATLSNQLADFYKLHKGTRISVHLCLGNGIDLGNEIDANSRIIFCFRAGRTQIATGKLITGLCSEKRGDARTFSLFFFSIDEKKNNCI